MTKISLTNDLKLQALQQYHPYISIDLWSLTEEERFIKAISDTFTPNSNDAFIYVTLDEPNVDATFQIALGDNILYEQNTAYWQDNQTRLIKPAQLNQEYFQNLQEYDVLEFSLFDENNNLIQYTSYKVLMSNNDFYIDETIFLQDYVNVKIIENDIEQMLYGADRIEYQKYISKPSDEGYNQGNFDNIVFTPENDLETIIPYEYYNGVFYLRLPRFYKTISLHILTKYFNAMDNILLLKTEDIINIVNEDEAHTWTHSENTNRSEDKINITSTSGESQYGRYLIPLPKNIQALNTIEIDYFLTYTGNHNTNQIGIIDVNDRNYTSSQTIDKYKAQSTLIYEAHQYIQTVATQRIANNIYQDSSYSYSRTHNTIIPRTINLNTQIEGLIKYINDDLYIEQYNERQTTEINRKTELTTNSKYNYSFTEWPTDDE